ncbi:helix-turn-helix domain-containing protein [Nonlabens sp. YIK11]|uniref:helix-turn-helix domain-containing protein n=1 Tax=Nonlabens sp. YIK11 TaxID=1453349 RepID=UPI0009E89E72|nr:helix-turn-helix transcriptional regulator [Nonlabens sp. YIK11]
MQLTEKQIREIKIKSPLMVGELLKRLRKSKNLTQIELGSLVLMDRQYIYKLESGRVAPNISTLVILVTAMDSDLRDLFDLSKP